MFKDCTIDNLTIILGNKHQQETNNFGDSDECQDSEGDVCDHENDRFVKFDSYDDDQKTEIISLLDELEDIEFFWNREIFQSIWELWVLPEQFGSIYHKIHEPKVDVNKVNIDLNNPTDQVHCTRKLYSFNFPFSKVELGERLYDSLMCYKIVQLNLKGDIVDVYVGR